MALLPPISKTTRQNFLNFCMRPQILVHMNKLCWRFWGKLQKVGLYPPFLPVQKTKNALFGHNMV